MWTVVYMSKDMENVETLRKSLKDVQVISVMRKNEDFYELLVPSMEVPVAHKIIIDMEI